MVIPIFLENARENNKKVWIAIQDMAKAFNSIGMKPLQYTFERLKISRNIIGFILNFFKDRQISIITHYGLTDFFIAKAGIDQSKVILPLI